MKKIFKIIGILLAIFALGIILILVITIPAENKLREEIIEMYDVVDKTDIDYELEDKYINRTISKGDNEKAEKAIKEYASKFIEFNKLYDKLNDDDAMNVTAVANIEKDKPDFNNSLSLLNDEIENLKIMNQDLDYLFNKDNVAYELIKYKTDDVYLVDLFEELTVDNNLSFNKEDKKLRGTLDQIEKVVNTNKELIMFLKNNPSVWSISDGNVTFKDDISYNQYMDIVK